MTRDGFTLEGAGWGAGVVSCRRVGAMEPDWARCGVFRVVLVLVEIPTGDRAGALPARELVRSDLTGAAPRVRVVGVADLGASQDVVRLVA